jgi:Flp pilus assembly protein TadB
VNSVLIASLLAAGCGLGAFVLLRALRRRPVELVAAVQAVQDPSRAAVGSLVRAPDEQLSSFQRYLSRPGLRLLESFGLSDRGLLESRLRILGKSLERHAYEKMFAGVVGLILPLAVGAVATVRWPQVPPAAILVASVLMGMAGFFYPDLPLAGQVANRQRAFRHSLSSYLDLVSITLAGGGGVESALVAGAEAGDGWVFAEFRSALRRGELTGLTPWDSFERLGEHYGIDELRELASSVALAGGQGARVRQSLVAKAEALRAQQTAEIEAMAESNTEKMVVPVSVMVLGLMVFIGRGAIAAIGV